MKYVYMLSEEYDEWFESIHATLKSAQTKVTSRRWKRVETNCWSYKTLDTVWIIRRVKVQE